MMAAANDFAQLAEDLSPEDLRNVLAVFATDVRRLVGNLTAAAAAADPDAFKRVAHGLAGAAGAVGAAALDQACRRAMTRTDLTAAELKPIALNITGLADTSLRELAAFVERLDAAARRA